MQARHGKNRPAVVSAFNSGKPRALFPALRAAYAGILENLDDLPAGSPCHRLKLPTLIISVLFGGADSYVNRDTLHEVLLQIRGKVARVYTLSLGGRV